MERKEKKIVLIVINGLGGGGSQRNVSIIANHISSCNHEVHIAVLLDPCQPFYELDENIKVHYIVKNNRSFKSHRYWIKKIKSIIKERNVETVIAIGYRFGLLCSLCINKKNKLIIRGTITRKMSYKDKILFLLKKRKIKTIVSQTDSQKEMYPAFLKKKIITIPNPFDVFDSNLNSGGYESKRFICVGRLFLEQKRQDYIIKSMIPFFIKHPDYSLEFYGEPQIDDDGSTLVYLNTLISQNNFSKNIRINAPTKNIWDIAMPSTAFLCASTREGMPNALIEAMLRGVVPVSTCWDGCKEIINDKINGLLISDDKENAFSLALDELISDKDNYLKMSNNSFSLSKSKYKKDYILEKWDKLL